MNTNLTKKAAMLRPSRPMSPVARAVPKVYLARKAVTNMRNNQDKIMEDAMMKNPKVPAGYKRAYRNNTLGQGFGGEPSK